MDVQLTLLCSCEACVLYLLCLRACNFYDDILRVVCWRTGICLICFGYVVSDIGSGTAFQSKARRSQTRYTDTSFCSSDLDLDPMTLIYELDVAILMVQVHTKINVVRRCFQKLEQYKQTTDRHSDRQTYRQAGRQADIQRDRQTLRHTGRQTGRQTDTLSYALPRIRGW